MTDTSDNRALLGDQRAVRLPAAVTGIWLLRAGLMALVVIGAGLWHLGRPELSWDEGWTLSVARSFVEQGHYGRLLLGEAAPGGLEASPAVTLPVALGMRLLGVGIWQGRLFGVLCAAGAMLLLFGVVRQLYGPRPAWGTIAVLLLLPMHPQLNGLLLGRQVLGEMPMMLWLIAGYACLLAALRRSLWWLVPATLLWGMARFTKTQFSPFWLVSLLVPLVVTLVAGRWRYALGLAGSIGATLYLVPHAIGWPVGQVLSGRTLPGAAVSGLYDVTALVTEGANRRYAFTTLVMFGLPTVLGLAYAAWRMWRERHALRDGDGAALVRLSLLTLAASWLAWYALLSVGVPRYLFPPVFIGSIFTALLLHDLTSGYDVRVTVARLVEPLRARQISRGSLGAWVATLVLAAALPLTLLSYARYYFEDERSAQRVASYLNTQTPTGALVETYESELHFLLDRPYHYPPDQVHVELNRRSLLGQDAKVDYDPLAADPDYLVVGRFARGNRLYGPIVSSGAFDLVLRDGLYEVYRRVRS